MNTVLCDLNGLAGGYLLPELVQDGNKGAGEGTLCHLRASGKGNWLGLFLRLSKRMRLCVELIS